MLLKVKAFLLKYKLPLTSAISFIIPLIVYIVTLEKKLVGGDTTWFALQIPQMYVLVPTGYPVFSLLGKLISLVPVGDLAYRLNLLSAIFGALTILFLFLGINKLVKNEIISLITAMSFAFLKTYWSIASRLEFDTLNSFFIVLIIFSILHYRENTTRNRLYFTFFCLGLSLTNHPIAFFVMPAFLVYLIIINPRIFKSIKTILLSILFFLIPLVSYVYIPIRSLQGYGTVTTLKKFLYHVTGREATGKAFGGFYQRNSFADILKVVSEFFKIIFTNFLSYFNNCCGCRIYISGNKRKKNFNLFSFCNNFKSCNNHAVSVMVTTKLHHKLYGNYQFFCCLWFSFNKGFNNIID